MITLDFIPVFGLFILTVLLCYASIECGFRAGNSQRWTADKESASVPSAIVGPSLGLLAFILAITFSIAAARFDERRVAIVSEANAIGTAYLRADILDEPDRERVKELLRQYTVAQIIPDGLRNYHEAIQKSDNLQDKLWKEAVIVAHSPPHSPIQALFIDSINEVVNTHTNRVALGLYARMPVAIWFCLFAVTALTMAGVGFNCGLAGNRNWLATIVLVGSFSIIVYLVTDLERPRQGYMLTSQQPLIDLSNSIGKPKM